MGREAEYSYAKQDTSNISRLANLTFLQIVNLKSKGKDVCLFEHICLNSGVTAPPTLALTDPIHPSLSHTSSQRFGCSN